MNIWLAISIYITLLIVTLAGIEVLTKHAYEKGIQHEQENRTVKCDVGHDSELRTHDNGTTVLTCWPRKGKLNANKNK